MDDFITIKCPGCGREMQLANETRSGSCSHCATRVNYRDAENLPSHISAETDEKGQFADSAEAARTNPDRVLQEADEIVPVKKLSYNSKKRIGAIASIILYSVTLIVGVYVIMILPGMYENFIKTPFFIIIAIIFILRIGLSVYRLIQTNKNS